MTNLDLEREIRELKRRLDLAETKLAQLEGRFEFISGQLRDIRLYMHSRFEDMDRRIDKLDHEIRSLRSDLPGIVGHAVREALRGRG